MDMSVFFAGTAGSVPSARRGLPAILVRRGGDRLLFDCGEGTQRQLLRSVGLLDLDAVFVTHFHADHWLGLPGMLKSFALRERSEPLSVYGPPGLGALMEAMRVSVYGRLPYELSVTELEPTEAVAYDGYVVAAIPVRHKGESRLWLRARRGAHVQANSIPTWPSSWASRPGPTSVACSAARPSATSAPIR